MQGIGPGSILGGRYTADRRTAQYAGAERWTARDGTLERSVVLFTVPRTHPNVDAVLDAARRSAGLDNARLSRILDVGSDDDIAYVVEESLEGSHSLAALLSVGPLPAPEVRRIAGETALVLDLARHRGLHHQRLTPDLVMRTADGDVKVRGLATMAALAGVDDVDDQTAARTDAMAVVAIAYAGFTGHWPLPGAGGGLPPAPRVASHVAAPSEIAVGVPADLDALCRLTFANDQGPTTPGDFARQIAPWSPIPVLLPTLDAPEQVDLSHSGGSSRRPSSTHGRAPSITHPSADRPTTERSGAGEQPMPQSGPTTPSTEDERAAGAAAGAAAGVAAAGLGGAPLAGPEGGASAGGDAAGDTGVESSGAEGEAVAGKAVEGTGAPGEGAPGGAVLPVARRIPAPAPGRPPAGRTPAVPARSGGPTAVARPNAPAGPAAPDRSDAPAGPSPLAAMTAATTAALGSAGAATVGAAKSLSGRLSDWTASTRDRARGAVQDARSRREESAAARAVAAARPNQQRPTPTGGQPLPAMGQDRSGGPDTLDPPVPLLPASAAEPLTREQSRMAIGILVGFVVLAFVFAMWGLSRIPSLPTLSGDEPTGSSATATPTAGSTETTDSDGDGTPDAPAGGAPLTFTAAADYDPLGDGAERPEDLERILDGDDSTAWGSEGYRSSAFSGLKAGLGIVLDLGETSPVSAVTLVLPTESTGRIYLTDDAEYTEGGKELADDLAEAGTFEGSGTVTTEIAAGSSGRYVIVWFTEISQGDEEWYRARLAGASATS